MGSITIRNLEDGLKHKLRMRAALAGKAGGSANLFAAIRRRIAPLGGVDLGVPRRDPVREPPHFDE